MTTARKMNWTIIDAYTTLITKYGGHEEARALLDLLMSLPGTNIDQMLLRPIREHGDLEMARELYRWSVDENGLREKAPYEALHALGYMGLEECSADLVKLLRADHWHITKNACLGLLHLNCSAYRDEIEALLNESFGKGLFIEFLPALASQVADRSIVPRLAEWGNTSASTDCNAGLILGMALFGSEERETIRQILRNPDWDAHDGGTGTRYWAYAAMQHVGILFAELIEDVKTLSEQPISKRELEHRLDVLHAMLECKLNGYEKPIRFMTINPESIAAIYSDLFEWTGADTDDSLIGLISQQLPEEEDLLEKYYHLRDKMELAMRYEAEMEHFRAKKGARDDKNRSIE
ncbi:hypothetical protein QWJ34_14230 [Saccharibacillus sp. CPCC 101409]|uniref:hypothetical protein n=1 Tax=Saccharibacillus sp. CPCC 101409 TaxID=3058041 RepID=UPI0026715D2B|nr:hypothetical protein [Saccharibacillus sp. CPCC 101409]MDO3410925.1 hypothetical protein [Saccharibacillus sp. CPCC 101409]